MEGLSALHAIHVGPEMKKFTILAVAAMVVAAFLLLRSRVSSANSCQSFFEMKTGISLPEGMSNVDHFDELEFACSSHYTLPVISIARVVEVAGLSPKKPEGWRPIFRPENLTPPWNEVPEEGDLLFGSGADQTSAWDIVFDKSSGSLWTLIYWPDFSGDLPGRALGNNQDVQPDGAGQSATPPKSKLEGGQNSKTGTEARSR